MSHEVDTMAYAGSVPWHGLGKKVLHDLTPEQMMKQAGVDWKVEEVESFATFNGQLIPTGQKCLIRSDTGTLLSNVGMDWHTVQNEEAFAFFNEYVRTGGMDMETAGSLKGGKVVWALAKVKESFEVFGEDRVDAYLLFSNPHEYGKPIDIRFTPIRVVCNNTLTLSLRRISQNAVRISHKVKFDAEQVKTTLGIARTKLAEYKEAAEFLGSKRYTKKTLEEYFKEVFPYTGKRQGVEGVGVIQKEDNKKIFSNNAKRCLELVESQPGAEFAEGTWWQAINAVTFNTDHLQGRDREKRLHSQWYGTNQQRKVTAFNKVMEYAKAA